MFRDIPEVHADHLKVAPHQQKARGLERTDRHESQLLDHRVFMALAPSERLSLRRIMVNHHQAISGAATRVASMDITRNVIHTSSAKKRDAA